MQKLAAAALGVAAILVPGTINAGEQTAKSKLAPSPVEKKEESNFLSFWDGRLVIDVEERIRGEIRENNRDFDSSVHDDNDDSWLLNRFRLGLAVRPVSWLKLYGQTQDSREAFSDRANIPGIHGAEGDDIFDLRQGYVAIGDVKKFQGQWVEALTAYQQSLDIVGKLAASDPGNAGWHSRTCRPAWRRSAT